MSTHNTQAIQSIGQAEVGPAKERVIQTFLSTRSDLELIEAKIKTLLNSEAPELSQISTYLLNQGGKRIRPVLCILSQRMFGYKNSSQDLIDVAAGIELIHMATLLHDDIIDRSPTRRHQKSAFAEFGLAPSLLTGDFLLVRAFGLCAQLDDFIVKRTEEACVALTEGEILEGVLSDTRELTLAEYINVIDKKTASLFALAAEVGAHLANQTAEVVKTMRNFGQATGLAFQMVDDILDITADEDLLGKPAGTDLRQKTPSLVNILWLESDPTQAREFFAKAEISEHESKQAANYLRDSEIINQARKLAEQQVAQAYQYLADISQHTDKTVVEDLSSIIDYTLERCR